MSPPGHLTRDSIIKYPILRSQSSEFPGDAISDIVTAESEVDYIELLNIPRGRHETALYRSLRSSRYVAVSNYSQHLLGHL